MKRVSTPVVRGRGAGHPRGLGLALSLVLVLGAAAPRARAADGEEEQAKEARRHYNRAEAHFTLGEFAPALESYRKAYLARPHPALLFNMAQCQRHLGQPREATFLLRRFLASSPPRAQRQSAEAILKKLEEELAAVPGPPSKSLQPPASEIPAGGAGRAASEGTGPGPISTATRPARETSTKKAAAQVPPSQGPPSSAAVKKGGTAGPLAGIPVEKRKPESPRRPFYKTWWFWTLVGGALAATVTATAVGVTTGRESPPEATLGSIDYR
jgi:hypothetical protein